jgi:hypothetical protein
MRDPQSWNAYSYVRNNPLEYTDPDGQDWTVCESNGSNCAVVKDDNAFDKFNQQTGNYVENGNYYDSNGNQIGTASWSQAGGDAFSMLNRAGNMAAPGVNLAAQGLRIFGYVVAAPAMVAADCLAGSPDCTKGNVAMAVLPELGALKAGGTLLKAGAATGKAAEIIQKAGGLAQATKDFEALSGAESVNGAVRVKTFSDGSRAVLYESTSGPVSIGIQDAAGRTVTKIRY